MRTILNTGIFMALTLVMAMGVSAQLPAENFHPDKSRVEINNLPANFTKVDLVMLMQPYGKVSDVKLEQSSKKAIVVMDKEAAKKAVQGLNGKDVHGSKLSVISMPIAVPSN